MVTPPPDDREDIVAGLNPHVEILAPWVSAGVRRVVPTDALKDAYDTDLPRVAEEVAAAGGRVLGPAYGCYHGMPTDTVDVEIGFGIDRAVDVPRLTITEHPATRAVVGTHVGPYDDLARSYGEMMPWIQDQGLDVADHVWELYDSPPDVDPSETVTRLVFPLR